MSALLVDLTDDPDIRARALERLAGPFDLLTLDELRGVGTGVTLRRLRRTTHDRCVVLVNEFRLPSRWLSMVLLGLAARSRHKSMIDRHGTERRLTWLSFLTRELSFAARRAWLSRRAAASASRAAGALASAGPARPLDPAHIAFVRADLGPSLVAGGSVAHICGVISGFRKHHCSVRVLTPTPIPGMPLHDVGVELLPADAAHALSVELPHLAYNATFLAAARAAIGSPPPDLLYQRHALGFYGGASLSQLLGIPLVVEFNGPEVWIARHWGAARRHLEIFAEIERRVLRSATLVVAVSEALREPLHAAGVDDSRILINPNGVDAERFDPAGLQAARRELRARLKVADGEVLAGFVGTFGPWHGAEVLAASIGLISTRDVSGLRFLFIGDGPRRAATEAILAANGRADRAVFIGLVAQDATPGLLAACDLCLAPLVANQDGSPFFGSPTKLFEYLASGRPVIASRLGQLGEVLDHDRNAWLVPPGDPDALAEAIVRLAGDPALRARLGGEGLSDAREKYGWESHVARILARLSRPVSDASA